MLEQLYRPQEQRLTCLDGKRLSASPGTEDCLKLWVWAPASATTKRKLPVMVYTHGGGMQNSQVRPATSSLRLSTRLLGLTLTDR